MLTAFHALSGKDHPLPLSDPLQSPFPGLTMVRCPGGFLAGGQGLRILVSQIPCMCANFPSNLSPTLGPWCQLLAWTMALGPSPQPLSLGSSGQPSPTGTRSLVLTKNLPAFPPPLPQTLHQAKILQMSENLLNLKSIDLEPITVTLFFSLGRRTA